MTADPNDTNRRLANLDREHGITRTMLESYIEEGRRSRKSLDGTLTELKAGFQALSTDVKKAVERVHSRVDRIVFSVGGTVILVLLGMVGWMFATWGPWGQ